MFIMFSSFVSHKIADQKGKETLRQARTDTTCLEWRGKILDASLDDKPNRMLPTQNVENSY
eukprot:5679806-Amphidinium_carterae.1